MRILEIGKFYPPERGGMETALREDCRGLVKRGHEVRALVASSRPISSREVLEDVLVHRVACLGRIRSLPIVPTLGLALRRILRELDPEVVHLHLPNPSAVLAWRLAGDGRPLVITYHSDIVRQRWLARAWAPWRRHVLQESMHILTTSDALLETSDALRPLRAKCTVLPLAIDVSRLEAVNHDAVAGVRARVGGDFVLFVGRLVYYKGLNVLLDAVAPTEVRLVVAGDGPLRKRLERRIQTEGLAPRVQLVGNVDEDELRALYHACTALVLPSTAPSEAFGLVQLEAMACGKPVVVSRASGGVASVPEDGVTGLLVDPRDPRALREALVRLWRDRELARRMGEAGRARVHRRYRASERTAQLEAILGAAAGYVPANGRSTTP